MNALKSARLGLAGSLVGYVLVIGSARMGMIASEPGFLIALALIAAMALCAAACIALQGIAWTRRTPPSDR